MFKKWKVRFSGNSMFVLSTIKQTQHDNKNKKFKEKKQSEL